VTSAKAILIVGGVCALLSSIPAAAQQNIPTDPPSGPTMVSAPAVPTITPAVRDLPDWRPDPNLFELEMKRRDDFGFIPVDYAVPPRIDPRIDTWTAGGPSRAPDGFGTPIHNYPGQSSGVSPPDTTGDIGPNHYVQSINQSVSTATVYDKNTGAALKTFTLQSLATASPCNSGFCDSMTLYDRMADRWIISELPGSGGSVCVYVSTSGDPTGTYYAYNFAIESSTADYPKYGIWPQGGNGGSFLIGVNAGSGGRDVIALDRAKMLAGLPATFQKFTVPSLPNVGFQLVLPATMQGDTPPPDGEPALFMRPRDDESQDGANTPTDALELWELRVDWATPANSTLTQKPSIPIDDYDMTLCGLGGTWNCMPQPGTSQKIDPIREPLHWPLQYRNFGDRQTLVGTFAEDVDGTDHAAMRWFELQKVGAGSWTVVQEGLVGGEAGVHRSVGAIAMDGAGNIALGYTRTGVNAPYYPSMYYTGRQATDPLGTMTAGENVIADATTSKTNNERWGDYAAMGVDPEDDCTFWFTSEYSGQGLTRIAAFKFDSCGCLAFPDAPTASASTPQDNRVDVSWGDSTTPGVGNYLVYRATTSGGPYSLIGTVADANPGTAGGPTYVFHDDAVSGGTTYYYVVKSKDAGGCPSVVSNEASVVATGLCTLAPTFGGLASVANGAASTCTLNLAWSAGASACTAGTLRYNVYRGTSSGFTPGPSFRIATGVPGTAFTDSTAIENGVTYYYVVRAVDTINGLEEGNGVKRSASPTGPITPIAWTDTFEGAQSGGGFDLAGWSHAIRQGSTDWVWSTAQKKDGTHSWFAADVSTTSDKVLTSPSFIVGPLTTLTFWHTYRFQGTSSNCPDGGTLEYTTNGSTWSTFADADFTTGGFNGFITSRFNPISGQRAWCQGNLGAMTQVVVNLGGNASLQNKSVQVRWREGDDGSGGSTGWYVDSVSVANAQIIAVCSAGTGALTVSNNGPVCEGATLALSASWSQPGVTYSWSGPNGFTSALQNPTIPGATAAASGAYYVAVQQGAATVASNVTNATVAPAAPATAGLTFASATGLQWAAAPSATSYDVVRGTLSTLRASGSFTPATDACAANDVAATSIADSHVPAEGDGDWFLVRAVGACGGGSYDDGSPAQVASRDAGVGGSANACP
jgi:hypothetical protein